MHLKPDWKKFVPALAAAGAMALFTALGFWQLGRAEFKRELLADLNRAGAADARSVESVGELETLERFRSVEITGSYDARRQIMLDNRIVDGRAGVEVFTALHVGDGAVLVNRGWLPMPPDRSRLPAAPAPDGEVTVHGLVSPPPAVGIQLGDIRQPESWPWLTPYLRLEAAEHALGASLGRRVILLSPNEPGGFLREWTPASMTPERHVGYAVQWFALAAAVAVVWLVLGWRSRRPGREARR